MAWAPPQQAQATHYIRWTIISAFVVCMLWLVSFFHSEYLDAQAKKQQALTEIAKIEEHNAKVDAQTKEKSVEPPPAVQRKKGGVRHKSAEPSPVPVAVEKDSKIEIDAGIVKIAMSNEASWTAIFKIVFTLLFTFFGIKLINFGFRKLEGAPAPA